MKKIIFMAIAAIISVTSFGQKKDSVVVKHDTIPMYVYHVTDSVKVAYLYKRGRNVAYAEGFALLTGWKVQGANGLVWAKQPDLSGLIDDKKRPVKTFIKIL